MIGWKVLRKRGKYSAFARRKAAVQYGPHWAHAPEYLAREGYHLLFFGRKRDALAWARLMGYKYIVVKVETRGGVRLPKFLTQDRYQFGYVVHWRYGTLDDWPYGTKMAKEIRIVGPVA